jgi:hypothetical protein
MSYPLLEPGSLVKPQVAGLRFHWLTVIADPGPARNPRCIIELARTEPERADTPWGPTRHGGRPHP